MSPAAMIILRIIHIVAGSFMVGVALFNVLFVFPAARESGVTGGQFVGRLLGPSFQRGIGIAGMLAVLSGLIMMWSISAHFSGAWFHSRFAMALSTGALFAIAAMGVGGAVVGKAALRLGQLTAGGAPPSPEAQAEIASVQARLQGGVRALAVLLVLTAASMAAARYL